MCVLNARAARARGHRRRRAREAGALHPAAQGVQPVHAAPLRRVARALLAARHRCARDAMPALCTHTDSVHCTVIVSRSRADSLFVIGLFPAMLPKEYAEAMCTQYPDSLPQLERPELERALQALKLYLTDARSRVQMQLKTLTAQQAKLSADKSIAALVSSDGEMPDGAPDAAEVRRARASRDGAESREFLGGSAPLAPDGPPAAQLKRVVDELKQAKILASIVDTTLLKCYLQVFTCTSTCTQSYVMHDI